MPATKFKVKIWDRQNMVATFVINDSDELNQSDVPKDLISTDEVINYLKDIARRIGEQNDAFDAELSKKPDLTAFIDQDIPI